MHFIYGYFIIQLKCFNAFNCFFISQLDPGAQKYFSTRPWCSERPDSRTLARLALEFSVQREQQCIFSHCHSPPIPSIALSVHCLSWSAISLSLPLFNPGARLYCTAGVQCTIKLTLHYVKMHCRSFCLSFTLWRTAEQRRKAFWRPRLSPVHI